MSQVEFSEESVLAAAREAAGGLSDFGPEDFRDGLRVLLATYDTAGYSERGRKRSWRRVVQLLSTRLKVQEAFRQHPEIRERALPRPLFVTGLPRSGTSALFNLLAEDPAARALLLWEATFPEPADGLAPGEPDPRRQAIDDYYARMREKNPEFTKIHYASADTPEECVLLHAFAFDGVQLGVEPLFEPYASWYHGRDLGPMYAYYADLLRLLDWQRPGERWTLKAPAHMFGLDRLLAEFPDASIVWTHRNPLQCIASICSMTAALMDGFEQVDKTWLGPVVMEFYAGALDRGLAVREGEDPKRFLDVDYRRFVDAPLDVVREIYAHFSLPIGAEADAALESYADANPKGKHGSHEYALAEFGLTPDAVRERFADYVERFGLPTDASGQGDAP